MRLIEEQIAKRAQEADTKATQKLASASSAIANVDKEGLTEPATPQKIDLGTIALIGTAIGGMSALVGGFLSALFGLGMWLPFGMLGMLLLISGPSMLLAWMKLRQRNLGPILDANGWAINSRAKMNVPFGEALTSVAKLPAGSDRILKDPYSDRKRSWILYLVIFLLLLLSGSWFFGKLDTFLPESFKASKVLVRESSTTTIVLPPEQSATE